MPMYFTRNTQVSWTVSFSLFGFNESTYMYLVLKKNCPNSFVSLKSLIFLKPCFLHKQLVAITSETKIVSPLFLSLLVTVVSSVACYLDRCVSVCG